MSLSKQQWEVIEKMLVYPFGKVKLRCDAYEITAHVTPLHGMKLVVAVFVDGEMKGAWLDGKDERCLKFYRKKTKYLLKPAQRKRALEASKSRSLKKEDKDFFRKGAESVRECWEPYWPNSKSFCCHIQKTCQSIEFVE